MNLTNKKSDHRIFVDAHVHIHDCFCLLSFLDAAVENFQKASVGAGFTDGQKSFILLLAESDGKNHYQRLCELAEKGQTLSSPKGPVWNLNPYSDHGVLCACRSDGQNVFLFAGRQVTTAENLEVLALMNLCSFEEKLPLFQTVQAVRESGGVPVIPWGFGKWIGKRGRILKKFLIENDELMFLGDNGGRPWFWPRPRLFSILEASGGRILPGSDPLPLPFEVHRVGSFGFTMNAKLSSHMVRDLKKCLEDSKISISAYGDTEKTIRFFRNQFLIRIRGRI